MTVHRLQSCDVHGVIHRCGKPPRVANIKLRVALDQRVRLNEGPNLPVGYVPDDPFGEALERDRKALRNVAVLVAGLALIAIAGVLT